MITDVDSYFTKGCGRCARFDTAACSARVWAVGLAELRKLCLAAGLAETVKWGHPCYIHKGRNIVLIGAFRGDFRLTFMNASLLKDGAGQLEKAGPNSQHANVLRFVDVAEVKTKSAVIRAYLAELMGYAEANIKPPESARDLELPEVLVEALDADPELAEGFSALTPGRQRSYVVALSSAKKRETQVARIAKYRTQILAGKGAMER